MHYLKTQMSTPIFRRVRVISLLILLGLVLAHFGIKALLATSIDAGFSPGSKIQKLQFFPLFFIPFFALQIATGLSFFELEKKWKSLPQRFQWALVFVLFAAVAISGFIYVKFLGDKF